MPRKKSRDAFVYWRNGRAYGDFRCYSKVGGKQEALIPDGETRATNNETVANRLLGKRIEYFEGKLRGIQMGLPAEGALLDTSYIEHHLAQKEQSVTDSWINETRKHLTVAREFFEARGESRLSTINVEDIQAFVSHLKRMPNGRGGTQSGRTQIAYLHALSNLYRRAQSEGRVPPGYNPVSALMSKPKMSKGSRLEVLEIHDAALYLEAARLYRVPQVKSIDCPHELIATFLLTGGRESEIYGLLLDDVDLKRGTITIWESEDRTVKNRTSNRTIPLWPQLREVLEPYIERRRREGGRLLFRSPLKGKEQMLTDTRKMLDSIGLLAGFPVGTIRTRIFRHTYASVRLQTLDNGHPVSPWLVAREMGHGGTRLIDRIYGHPLQNRHRLELVEYRVGDHATELDGRIESLHQKARQQYPPSERALAPPAYV